MHVKKLLKKETKKLLRALTHPTFIYLTIVGNMILFGATTIVYFLERNINPKMTTFFDYIWWGVSTTTTIGYGDMLPITLLGRIIAIGLMYTGAVLFVTFTGVILTVLMEKQVELEINPLEKEIRQTEKEQKEIVLLLRQIIEKINNLEQNNSKS